jgi:competence ComEA-like helix-hairpin-helix protein
VTTEMQGNLPIDVNTASSDDLLPIDGIGPALAQRIVQYREDHGPFANLDELAAVKGIGPALLDRIRPQITITPATEAVGATESSMAGQEETPQLASPIQVSDEAKSEGGPPGVASDVQATSAEEPEGTAEEEEIAMPEEQTPRKRKIDEEGPDEQPQVAETSPAEEQPAAESESGRAAEDTAEAERAEEAAEEPSSKEEVAEGGKAAEQPEVAARETDAGRGFWWGFLLVAGGAIIGALVMLLVLLAYSGTLSYASRNEMEALSRNLDTVYHNSQVAWERIDGLAGDNADLSAKVDRLMALSGRVAELEQGTQEMRDDLAATEKSIAALESDLAELRDTYGTRFDEMDATLEDQSRLLDQMESDLAEARATMETMQQRLTTYDTFFGALRDLLVDMQGLPGSEAPADEAPVEDEEASGG